MISQITVQENPMSHTFSHGYALLIGVGEAVYTQWSLPVTVRDVQAVRAVLIDPALCGYPNDDKHVRLLRDQSATRAAILEGLAWLKDQAAADPEATAVVYYSGHGWLDQVSGHYYLVPHDVEPFDLQRSALAGEDFTRALREVRARRLLVIIDSCHAQGVATSKEAAQPVKLPSGLIQVAATECKGLLEALKRGEGRAVFTSSRGHQISWIRADGSLSVFTHHFLEALQGGGAKVGDTAVRLSDLMGHLSKTVPASAQQMHSAEQVPFFDTATEDFPVALLRGGKGLPGGGWEAAKPEAEAAIRRVINVVASGERSVAVGAMQGGVIMTGDQGDPGRSAGPKRGG
jgi:uncharacterized caspase-like protein